MIKNSGKIVFLISFFIICMIGSNVVNAFSTEYSSTEVEYLEMLDKADVVVDLCVHDDTIKLKNHREKKYIKDVLIISPRTEEILNRKILKIKHHPDIKKIIEYTISAWKANKTKRLFKIGRYYTTVTVGQDRHIYILAILEQKKFDNIFIRYKPAILVK
ncbi:MAG: hypothetical protein K9L78_00455 [Victivallales bacterium]|nr:hypothetical protein [Victivallales bacterium]MCF7888566.1 hypothetical protein [Victivallales bacterium]